MNVQPCSSQDITKQQIMYVYMCVTWSA